MAFTSPELDYDLDALEEYLLSPDLPDGTMTLSELDGYLTAIAVSPKPPPAEEWLPEIWAGAMPPLAVQSDTKWVVGAIMGHYEAIRRVLADDPERLSPIIMEDTDGSPLPELWAEGFMCGVAFREQDWVPLFESEGWRLLVPIGVFARTSDSEPLVWSEDRVAELRENADVIFVEFVAKLHGFWRNASERTTGSAPQPRAARPSKVKLGRNAPCMCGSGKKFKRCCGA